MPTTSATKHHFVSIQIIITTCFSGLYFFDDDGKGPEVLAELKISLLEKKRNPARTTTSKVCSNMDKCPPRANNKPEARVQKLGWARQELNKRFHHLLVFPQAMLAERGSAILIDDAIYLTQNQIVRRTPEEDVARFVARFFS